MNTDFWGSAPGTLLLTFSSICSPYPDCILIKGLAYALWLENNFKIIRHIFLLKIKTTTTKNRLREKANWVSLYIPSWPESHPQLEGREHAVGAEFCFLKILFSLRILITYSPTLSTLSLKTLLSKRFEDLGDVSIPLADLNPLLNN